MTRRLVGALIVGAGLAAGCGDPDQQSVQPAATPPDTVAATPLAIQQPQPTAAASCVEVFSPATLAGRAFAFEGTVTATSDEPDPRGPDDDSVVTRAEFDVDRWFVGEGRTPI